MTWLEAMQEILSEEDAKAGIKDDRPMWFPDDETSND